MKQPNIESLLSRYFDGSLVESERLIVEEWIKQSEENKAVAKQIYTLYLATDTWRVIKKVDTEKALTKVKRQMTVKQSLSVWEWIQRVAAILFIPLLITSLITHLQPKEEFVAQMMEIKTNPGMTATVVLSDSTVVYLNSESKLQYPSTFNGAMREVTLSGEAFFEVKKNEKKRFVVSTNHQSKIEVLGTSFNVEAYDTDSCITTTLLEGAINFIVKTNNEIEQVKLEPGQKVVYNTINSHFDLYSTSCKTETSWKNGELIFSNTSLEEALHMLEKRFGVLFRIKNQQLKSNAFTGVFTEQRLDRILEYFKISSNIQWRYIDNSNISQHKNLIEIY